MSITDQQQARIEAQMSRIVEQSTVINRQAQLISDFIKSSQESIIELQCEIPWEVAEKRIKEIEALIARAKGGGE